MHFTFPFCRFVQPQLTVVGVQAGRRGRGELAIDMRPSRKSVAIFSRSCRATQAHCSAALSHDCAFDSKSTSTSNSNSSLDNFQLQDMTGNISLALAMPSRRHDLGPFRLWHSVAVAVAAVAGLGLTLRLLHLFASAWRRWRRRKVSDSALHMTVVSHQLSAGLWIVEQCAAMMQGRPFSCLTAVAGVRGGNWKTVAEDCANQQAGTRKALSLNCIFHCLSTHSSLPRVGGSANACCVLLQLEGNRSPLLIAPNCCQGATWNEWP